ncbi:hypothetical protein PLESTB_001112000 [Pleodorina starrii]|uniref:D-serine dehydratase-like domain-containing protein n=1 Tax=Pleodorina starrii TaxID=330485 RepID=A0A9W6BQW0_9CHLO|nr:hypothetical protein PLESTM_001348900 [Pleodorina starrii]GLC56483.1 hypothetical protein PLESTB_001112000 [Pleodorina starrii]GLC65941.1 hypothetical protein PLESTF_000364500 [Pleodorina starrii]
MVTMRHARMRLMNLAHQAFAAGRASAAGRVTSLRCNATISANRPPATVGNRLADVDTPALLLDLDAFECNCEKLHRTMELYPAVAVRPHAKAHKSADVARIQLQLLGAKGVCCQKVVEAEAMAEGGIGDLLLSNEVVSPRKIDRLAGLAAAGARVGVCFESVDNLRRLNSAAAAAGTSLDVLVELNVGQDRCGVDSPAEVVALARAVARLDNVRFAGLQAYHGGLQHVRDPRDRAQRVGKVVERARAAVEALAAAGIACETVTGGGTGTYKLEAASGVFTEVQPGSFAFNDADYSRNSQDDGSLGEWEQSLWVLTQVMSVSPSRGLAVVDAGTKAVSLDSGPPQLPPRYGELYGTTLEYVSGGDEHGKLLWPQGAYQLPMQLPPVGSLLQLQPGHCDPTVNLYDWIVAVRSHKAGGGAGAGAGAAAAEDDSRVVAVWPVRGRGPGH